IDPRQTCPYAWRLNSRVRVAIECTEEGKVVRAEGYTKDVSRKGCLAVMPHPFAVGQKVRVTNLAIASQPECQRRIFDLAGARGSGRMGAGNRASRTDGGLLDLPGVALLQLKPPAEKNLEFPHGFGNSARTALFPLQRRGRKRRVSLGLGGT